MNDAPKPPPIVSNSYKEGDYFSDYRPIIESFGNPAIVVVLGYYEGDTMVLYDTDGVFGYLCFGWGSCSVCDALQSCKTVQEVQDLSNELYGEIVWFYTAKEALDWFNAHDWKGDYAHSSEFVIKAKEYLRKKLTYEEETQSE